jgi:hypothetical protein
MRHSRTPTSPTLNGLASCYLFSANMAPSSSAETRNDTVAQRPCVGVLCSAGSYYFFSAAGVPRATGEMIPSNGTRSLLSACGVVGIAAAAARRRLLGRSLIFFFARFFKQQ